MQSERLSDIELHFQMLADSFWHVLVHFLNHKHNFAGDVILFIDEVHNLIGSGTVGKGKGSGLDIANLLKPALARGELQVLNLSDFLRSALVLCRKDHTLSYFVSYYGLFFFVFLVHCSYNSR